MSVFLFGEVGLGQHIYVYEGHGRRGAQGGEGTGRAILRANELASELTNDNMYPFMISNCCETGWFDYPNDHSLFYSGSPTPDLGSWDCIAEVSVNLADAGAIGFLGSTRDSDTGAFGYIDQRIIEAIYEDLSHVMGEAVMESKLNMWNQYRRQYNLYGDPAINLCSYGFTVSEDITLSGEVDVTTPITVASGVTMTIQPGATLVFHPGASLTINGTLTAQGTSSNKITFTSASSTPQKGDWEGIIFDNANNSSSIQYCTIEYAVRGINTNATNLTIECSDINDNSGNGIKCHEASPTIYHNTIESNGIGILCESNSSPYINNNYVVNNTSYGIYCTQTSNPYIRHNEISNNGPGGLCCLNGSSPNLVGRSSSESYGANAIFSNGGYGVLVFSNSNPNLGYHFGYQAGYNDIYNHSYKQVANYTGNTIVAWRNWWGTANPGSELFYGSVDYSAHLTSSSPYAGPDWGQSLAKSLDPIAQNSPNDVEESLLKALEFEGAHNYEEAVENYRYVTDQYSETIYGPFALSRLMACRVKQGDITVEKNYLYSAQQKNDINQTGTTALLWQPLAEVRAGNEQEALELCDNIKNRYSDTNLIKDAKFLKGSIQLYEMNDFEAAKKTYDEFTQEYSEDLLIEHIKIMLENYQSYDLLLPKAKPQNRIAAPIMLTHFQLSQNFPNPFNPETEIQYQLLEDSHVRIEIFNLMGQKICTLVNKQQSTGFYSVRWNGRDGSGMIAASGVYLYQLHANKFMEVKKMLLLR